MKIETAAIFILNYNGTALLGECLPGILAAAKKSRRKVRVTVIDNHSTDGSLTFVKKNFPEAAASLSTGNRFLVSFNEFVDHDSSDAVVLMNNDIKVEEDFLDPLLDVFEKNEDALFASSLCWDFDKTRYEGGLSELHRKAGVWGTSSVMPPKLRPDNGSFWSTASIGACLAVRSDRFLELGGYDDLYLPGILEDLDLCYRGWRKGWRGYFVPESVIYHKGQASFKPAFGNDRIRRMAARNTYFFMWKNVDDPGLVLLDLLWMPVRILYALFRGDKAFAAGAWDALQQADQALDRRRRRPKDFGLTDRAILNLFKQQNRLFAASGKNV